MTRTHAARPAEAATPAGDLLRLVTAGSVDDGKSTLVGRLLHDTKSVLADQLDAVARTSEERGLGGPDLSLLVDGLRAEREQGITIDVAYRYFATPRRSFVLADTPGHVQYTRNTVTGASTARLAILLVDARSGVVEQTRRHAAVLALLGVEQLVLAVNKIDLVGYQESAYRAITARFREHATALGYQPERLATIPLSALHGDNVVEPSPHTPWYGGPTLLQHLESVPVAPDTAQAPYRFPVQYVIRPRTPEHRDYRGYAGQVSAGVIRVGDQVVLLPSGARSRVAGIDTADGPLDQAEAGRSVTVLLADELAIARGEVLAPAGEPPRCTSELEATLCWLSETPLTAGMRVLVKYGTSTVQAIVTDLMTRFDEQDLSSVDNPDSLRLNDIGLVRISTASVLAVDEYAGNRNTGRFLVIDPAAGDTLAAGLVGAPLPAGGRPSAMSDRVEGSAAPSPEDLPPEQQAGRAVCWLRTVWPGVVLAFAVGVVATVTHRLLPTLAAPAAGVLLGVLISLVHRPGARWRPGLSLVSSRALRIAIVVFGTGLSVTAVARVGLKALPVVVATLVLVAIATPLLGRLLGVHGNVRTLVGVASGLCGTSAIAAVTPIIAATEVEITYAIGAVFALNTVSVFTFPLVGSALGMSQEAFGVWAGIAVHDTSSVVAASLSFGAAAASVAIVVKLSRSLALIPLSVFLALRRRRVDPGATGRAKWTRMVPLFVLGFLGTATLNSVGLVPDGWHEPLSSLAIFLVTTALSAIGLSLRPADLVRTGPRPFLLALSLWVTVIVFSLTLINTLHGS